MTKEKEIDNEMKSKFEITYETRKLELELFWKRYSVFWTVTAAVFVAYGFSKNSLKDYSFIIACFGVVTSYAWFLINKGNKFWQETWEKRVHENDPYEMFKKWESVQPKGYWSGGRYSVSKIAIIISFFVFIFWFLLAIKDLLGLILSYTSSNKKVEFILYCVVTVLMFIGLIILAYKGKTTIKTEELVDDKLFILKKGKKLFEYSKQEINKDSTYAELRIKVKDLKEEDTDTIKKLFSRMPDDEK